MTPADRVTVFQLRNLLFDPQCDERRARRALHVTRRTRNRAERRLENTWGTASLQNALLPAAIQRASTQRVALSPPKFLNQSLPRQDPRKSKEEIFPPKNIEDTKDQRTSCGVLRWHLDAFRNRFT
ncbi:hypothetical protein PLICRDRAFT_266919 [Plicaturopsis crispa FD-325 SS-3]|nr:hypothetical protein PLICRDRAFT_266919 [Plicaturopsis crispa FD-325 SS-3]